jgi:hypothetical protein
MPSVHLNPQHGFAVNFGGGGGAIFAEDALNFLRQCRHGFIFGDGDVAHRASIHPKAEFIAFFQIGL